MTDKLFFEMTDDELIREHDRWDREVREATRWGAALAQAIRFRDSCRRMLDERARTQLSRVLKEDAAP